MRIAYVVVAACVCACGSVEKKPDAAVDAPAQPQVTALMPSQGIVTTSVTITGSQFGTAQGSVTVDGQPATVTSWSATSVAITIPDVLPGAVDVVVTTGGGASAPMKFTVMLPPAIYIDNGVNATDGFDTVSALAFDPATGAVTQIGQPVSLGVAASSYGGCSTSLWLHAHTRRLFASGGGKFAIYNINPVSGALTPLAGSPFDAQGGRSFAVITNEAGTRLWITNFDGHNVGVFDLAADGTPTPVAGSPFMGPLSTDTMTLSKDETLLFVSSYGGNFGGFSLTATGTMTALPANNPGGTVIMRRPGTDQLLIPTLNGTMQVWTAAADGTLTQLAGSPFTLAAANTTIQSGAFTPDGTKIYFPLFGGASIIGESLAADGTPTALTGSPWMFTGTFSNCAAISQDSKYLVATSQGAPSLSVFTLDASGTPTAVSGSPFTFMPASTAGNGLAITF